MDSSGEDNMYDSNEDKEYVPESSSDSESSHEISVLHRGKRNVSANSVVDHSVNSNLVQENTDVPLEPDGEVQRSRKRQRRPDLWKQAMAKRMRNSGQTYTNKRGKNVEGKTFVNLDCGCQKKCIEKITEDERRAIFQNFWKMADFSKQNAFLCGLVHQVKIKQRRPRDGTKNERGCSYVYFLQKPDNTCRVCKKFFLQTFGMTSDGRLFRALQKVKNEKSPGEDLRGKHVPAKKIPNEQKQTVIDHINMFPSFQSHYSRKDNPNRRFLSPDLNIRKMYELYLEFVKKQNKQPVKEHYYRFVFNTEFNLHFHTPRKDTCKICDKYKQAVQIEVNGEEKKQLEQQHNLHLRKAERARTVLKEDGLKSKSDENILTLTFDLQKALPFPILSVSEAYYRRNMYVYNLGVHNIGNGQAVMYVWDECTASRGSQEIASCLTRYIKTIAADKTHVILFSDTCTGQNRNLKLALSLMKLTQEDDTKVEVIDHKFMVSGHSFLPNDADFGLIEKQAKSSIILIPEHWYETIVKSRRKNKFLVVQMKDEDMLSTESLEKCVTKRKKDTDDIPVNWLQIQWLRYQKNKPFTIQYKTVLQEEMPFGEIDLKPNVEGRPRLLKTVEQEKLYKKPKLVNFLKKRDMLYLLKYIAPVHHWYFKNIKSSKDVSEDSESSSDDKE